MKTAPQSAATPFDQLVDAVVSRKPAATREAWLNRLARRMRPMFEAAGAPLPEKFRITMSLTKGRKTIGVCYDPSASADGHAEILIRLDQFEAMPVAALLAHELTHAAVGNDCGHKGRFRKVAKSLGLIGPMKSTTAGPLFLEAMGPILSEVGPFPHASLDFEGRRSGPKKQAARQLKAECGEKGEDGERCGYLCRVTAKWVKALGAPLCPLHETALTVEALEEEGEEGEGEDAAPSGVVVTFRGKTTRLLGLAPLGAK